MSHTLSFERGGALDEAATTLRRDLHAGANLPPRSSLARDITFYGNYLSRHASKRTMGETGEHTV